MLELYQMLKELLLSKNTIEFLNEVFIRKYKDIQLHNDPDIPNYIIAGLTANDIKDRLIKGSNPDSIFSDRLDKTALQTASQYGDINIMEVLLDYGATVDKVDSYGRTALHYASIHNQLDALKLLLSWGADLSIKDKEHLTALDLSEDNVREFIVRYIETHHQNKKGI